jgi:hypothetical protein
MANEMVMRSVYLRPAEDAQLRDLAFSLSVTKSDLIRSAIGVKLAEWLAGGEDEVRRDLESGRRLSPAERAERARAAAEPKATAKPSPSKPAAGQQKGKRPARKSPGTGERRKGVEMAKSHRDNELVGAGAGI